MSRYRSGRDHSGGSESCEAGQAAPCRRVVIKAGSALLTGEGGRLDVDLMETLVGQIARLRLEGVDVLLVTSGAVAAGRHVLGVVQKDGGSLRTVRCLPRSDRAA